MDLGGTLIWYNSKRLLACKNQVFDLSDRDGTSKRTVPMDSSRSQLSSGATFNSIG